MRKVLLLLAFYAFVFSDTRAQIYQFTNDINGVPSFVATNATGTGLGRVNGVLSLTSGCLDGFRSRNFPSTTVYLPSLSAIQFTVTPAPGYQLNVTSFSTDNQRNSSGPTLYRVAYSLDGGSTWINNGSNILLPSGVCTNPAPLTWNMADFSTTTPLLVRVFAFGAASLAGQQRLTNLSLNGTVTALPVPGCTDPIACNYNPAANVNDGSCVYPGCNNAIACNYDPTAGCDDGSCIVVGASCDDGDLTTFPDVVQPGCNCIGQPLNDEKAGAVALTPSPFGTCNNIIAAFMGFATPSANTFSTVVTGEDLWYSFQPASTGVRVEVFSGALDVVVELQDAAGVMIDQENVIAGTGYEYMNKDAFILGNTYYLVIRNNNSGFGTGWVDICLQEVPDSRIDNPIPLYSNTCLVAKADWTGAYQYHFQFTNNATLVTTSLTTTNSTYFVLRDVPGMRWNQDFNVRVNTTHQLLDAAGGVDALSIISDEITTMVIGPQPLMSIRPQDQCADGPNLLGSSIAGEPFVCMSTDYQWEFTRTDIPQPPIYRLRGAATRFIVLNSVPGLVANATYQVRVRPIFSYGAGNWGPALCMSTVSSSIAAAEGGETETPPSSFDIEWMEQEGFTESMEASASLYPNPLAGSDLFVNLQGVSSSDIVEIRCLDQAGREVMSGTTETMGDEDLVVHFNSALVQGAYILLLETRSGLVLRNRFVAVR